MSSAASGTRGGTKSTPSAQAILEQTPKGHLRLPEVLLFVLLPWEALTFRGIPVTELAGLAIVGLGLFRAPDQTFRRWNLKVICASFLIVAFVSTYLVNDVDGLRRLGHLGIWAGLMFVMASGRISFSSAATGLGVGVAIGAITGILGLNVLAGYDGRLTGLFGEPNLGGLIIIAYGLIAISATKSSFKRSVFIALCMIALILTLSRTSWMAAIIAAIWISVASRVKPWASVLIMATALPLLQALVEAVKNLPVFESRAGSDLLREEIVKAEEVIVSQSQILGHGAGSALVHIGEESFFFHNSYWALRAEFGWVGLTLVMVMIVTIFMRLVLLPEEGRNRWLEGAVLAVMACAINLGEVLLALQCSVVLGAALAWIRIQRTGRLEVPLSHERVNSRAST